MLNTDLITDQQNSGKKRMRNNSWKLKESLKTVSMFHSETVTDLLQSCLMLWSMICFSDIPAMKWHKYMYALQGCHSWIIVLYPFKGKGLLEIIKEKLSDKESCLQIQENGRYVKVLTGYVNYH